MGVVNDFAQHIHNNGLASLATSLFIGDMPDSPDNCIAIFETGGLPADIDLPTKKPTIQVLIRNTSYVTGRNLIDSLRSLFHQKYNTQLIPNGTYFLFINVQGEGNHIGRDDVGRDEFSINFLCEVRT